MHLTILQSCRYGKVFKSHLFGSPAIVSCDPELNAFVLRNENRLFECSYPKSIRGILGSSCLLVVVGDVHKRLRSQALNFISAAKSNHDFLMDIERNALLVINSWKDKQTVIFCEESRKVIKLIWHTFFYIEYQSYKNRKII